MLNKPCNSIYPWLDFATAPSLIPSVAGGLWKACAPPLSAGALISSPPARISNLCSGGSL